MTGISSFHGGRPLNVWERSCLQSFADFGHRLEIFSYDVNLSLPSGIRVADAAAVISKSDYDAFLARLPDGYPQFSDWFRYELLHQRGGWWMDTDVLCLSPSLPDTNFFLARKKGERVNNAVLAFPPGHPLVTAARDFARSHLQKLRRSRRVYIGPDLLTRLVKEQGLLQATTDPGVCYPFIQEQVFDLVDPEKKAAVEAIVAKSPFLHLFQESFRDIGFPRDRLPPKGSFLAEKFVEHGAPTEKYLDAATGRKFFEHEMERRRRVKTRPRGWRRVWRNVVAAVTFADRKKLRRRAEKV
jgi:hypothetical protein